jgi:hypothetical protein
MTRLLPSRPHAVVLAVGCALLLAACGTKEQPAPPDAHITRMVALGDSYAAGPGISPVADPVCFRSAANYASLASQELGVVDFEDVSCGGATTANLVNSQEHDGGPINQPQLSAVDASTDLVTLGIGLNDSGLSVTLLYVCLPALNQAEACRKYLRTPDSVLHRALDQVVSQVRLSLRSIKERAPQAKVILVGYPHMLPDTGACPDRLPLDGKSAERLRWVLRQVNEDYRKVARELGVNYLDMYTASAGHDVCSTSPWVNGVKNGGANGAPLHPTPAFERAVSERIVAIARGAS